MIFSIVTSFGFALIYQLVDSRVLFTTVTVVEETIGIGEFFPWKLLFAIGTPNSAFEKPQYLTSYLSSWDNMEREHDNNRKLKKLSNYSAARNHKMFDPCTLLSLVWPLFLASFLASSWVCISKIS